MSEDAAIYHVNTNSSITDTPLTDAALVFGEWHHIVYAPDCRAIEKQLNLYREWAHRLAHELDQRNQMTFHAVTDDLLTAFKNFTTTNNAQ